MLTLGFDTATAACTVALVEDGRLLVELTVINPRIHSTRLLPLIDQALQEAGRRKQDLAGVACGVGPGSFTGLRIGLSTAKAIAFALGLPCAPVVTLQAMAHTLGPGAGWVAPVLDARRGEVYTALYRDGEEVLPPRQVPLSAWVAEVDARREGAPVAFPGDVADERLPAWARPVPGPLRLPRGWAVAALGEALLRAGGGVAPGDVRPLYLRKTEPERCLEGE